MVEGSFPKKKIITKTIRETTTFVLDKITEDFARPTINIPKCKVITDTVYNSPPASWGKLDIQPCGAPYVGDIMCLIIKSNEKVTLKYDVTYKFELSAPFVYHGEILVGDQCIKNKIVQKKDVPSELEYIFEKDG